MGMMMGLATPRLVQMYESVSFSIERDDVLFQLQGLSFSVYQRGETFRLLDIEEPSAISIITLPDGWQLDSTETSDVIYNSFGYCSGGEVKFVKEDRELRLNLLPPTCRPEVL